VSNEMIDWLEDPFITKTFTIIYLLWTAGAVLWLYHIGHRFGW
jgi:hypothetical protein